MRTPFLALPLAALVLTLAGCGGGGDGGGGVVVTPTPTPPATATPPPTPTPTSSSSPLPTTWAGVTGYLPLTNAAVKAMEASGHYAKHPHQKTSVSQMAAGKTTPNSQGIRLGNFVSVRDAIEEQIENILSGKKTAKQGLDDAVAKSNDVLKEFAALYK